MGRKRSSDGSLDLLLDTITNTFGGVLFLAILVSLMLRHVGKATTESPVPDPMSEAEQIRAETRVEELRKVVEDLQMQINQLPVSDPDIEILRKELVALTKTIDQLVTEELNALTEITRIQRVVAEVRKKIEQLDKELLDTQEAVKDAKKELEVEQENAAELARLELEIELNKKSDQVDFKKPVRAQTTLGQVGIYLRFGRVYMMHKWSPGLKRLGPNPDHFFIQDDGDTLTAKPRPAAGVDANSDQMPDVLKQWLSPFRPGEWSVAVCAHRDSFREFQTVKAVLVSAGYKYNPIPATDDNPIVDTGGQSVAQ